MKKTTALAPIEQVVKIDREAEEQRAHYIQFTDSGIVWSRKQNRLVQALALSLMTSKKKRVSKSIYTLGVKLGLSRNHITVLNRFSDFWEAVNDEIALVLGRKNYPKIAKAIYHAALRGSHHDRRLYMEVFRNHAQKHEVRSLSYEERLIKLTTGNGKDDSADRPAVDVGFVEND